MTEVHIIHEGTNIFRRRVFTQDEISFILHNKQIKIVESLGHFPIEVGNPVRQDITSEHFRVVSNAKLLMESIKMKTE